MKTLTKAETIGLAAGTKVFCVVTGLRCWCTVVAVRPRDGYIQIAGYKPFCPPFNFALTDQFGHAYGWEPVGGFGGRA